MNADEAIKLLVEHDQDTVRMVHTQGQRGEKTAIRRQKASTKKVLAALLGRPPTEEELRQATKW